MAKVNGLYMDECDEVEGAAWGLLREAKYLSCAPASILARNSDWIEEARELLNDALAKASRVREAACTAIHLPQRCSLKAPLIR